MKKLYPLIFSFLLSHFSYAQINPAQKNYNLISGKSFVTSKNYYFINLLQSLPAVNQLLTADTTLQNIAKQKLQTFSAAPNKCQTDMACFGEQMKFSDAEIQKISKRLGELFEEKSEIKDLVNKHLIPSGTYILNSKLTPKEQLLKAWEQDAKGINFTISVYAQGQKPNYPAIDSTSFKVKSKGYSQTLGNLCRAVFAENKKTSLFFEPSLSAALISLELNEREQVADFEPMASTVNKSAFDRIKSIKWNNFEYSVILIPGAGNEEDDRALSAEGMLRCRVAAVRYFEGMAPFVMVSGGFVHPFKTKFNEAIEMKKYMIEKLHVPENAILVEPHARHTTTNMRNAARIIFRYGIPFDKPCITSTSKSQSLYIQELNLDKRCEQELKHIPYRKGRRLSETEVEFYPLIEALQINPLEPMDP